MIYRALLLVPVLVLLSPGFLRAQEETKAFDPFRPNASGNSTMYEDIEIFRRILDRKLEPLYPTYTPIRVGMVEMSGTQQGWGMGETQWMVNPYQGYLQGATNITPASAHHYETIRSLEGVYLKGQGLIYTATLPSLQPAVKAQTNGWEIELKVPRPVSEWESVRRQLRNEKEEPKKAEVTKPPRLTDVLLKVLAENGHHFSQLGETESLTLVLTVRGADSPAPTPQSVKETKKSASPTRSEEADSSASSKVRDLELLGDLHMKQEHYGMARDAFREAMELKPGREQTAWLARKLAQAYLKLGKIEEARDALDQALALTKEAADTKDKPAPRVKPSADLPVKLILSAPKKLLDQVKEGKITFEEFRAKAQVETLRFENRR